MDKIKKSGRKIKVFFHETLSNTYSSAECLVTANTKIDLSITRCGSSFIYLFSTNLSFSNNTATFGSINYNIYFNHNEGKVIQGANSNQIVVDKIITY